MLEIYFLTLLNRSHPPSSVVGKSNHIQTFSNGIFGTKYLIKKLSYLGWMWSRNNVPVLHLRLEFNLSATHEILHLSNERIHGFLIEKVIPLSFLNHLCCSQNKIFSCKTREQIFIVYLQKQYKQRVVIFG